MKANEINETYYRDYPEFRIRFQPNFTWADNGLYVSGIGIRATNAMISLKKDKRAEILKAYGFTIEKDINASVPRMTLSLNSGHRVWQVYDCFYSTGAEDDELFKYMVSSGVKLNFEAFLRDYWNRR